MRVNVHFYFMYIIIILFLNRCNTGRELIIQCVYTFESFDVIKKTKRSKYRYVRCGWLCTECCYNIRRAPYTHYENICLGFYFIQQYTTYTELLILLNTTDG